MPIYEVGGNQLAIPPRSRISLVFLFTLEHLTTYVRDGFGSRTEEESVDGFVKVVEQNDRDDWWVRRPESCLIAKRAWAPTRWAR